mmetsp:Transcript_9552/g.15648  ORF Transcript_9552/g.15648 Transcript_9552/m.15648 type:complete len:266 (+) Transcript_9552:416-1213(+)
MMKMAFYSARRAVKSNTYSSKVVPHPVRVHASTLNYSQPSVNTSSKAQDEVAWLGTFCDLGLAISKGGIGITCGCTALVADAVHSGSDLVVDAVTIASLSMSRNSVYESEPAWGGFRNVESMACLGISATLVSTAAGLAVHSVYKVVDLYSSTSTGILIEHAPLVISCAMASAVLKEWLYHKTLKVGKETNSKVLTANAWHHRCDSLCSTVALTGIIGSFMGMPMLDPLAGALVSGAVFKAGADVGSDAFYEIWPSFSKNFVLSN